MKKLENWVIHYLHDKYTIRKKEVNKNGKLLFH